MKWIIAGAVVGSLVVSAVGVAQVSPATARSVQRQIEPLMEETIAAANSHDTDRFLATYLHDSTLVFVFNGGVIVGLDSVRTLQLKWWNNGKSDVVYRRTGPFRFTVLGPDAAVVSVQMESSRTLSGGERRASAFAIMDVWQKRPEGWRVVQVHESTAPPAAPRAPQSK
jgi:uncharacterized protein (TIGR02246 family)